jgi:hypothetical protein
MPQVQRWREEIAFHVLNYEQGITALPVLDRNEIDDGILFGNNGSATATSAFGFRVDRSVRLWGEFCQVKPIDLLKESDYKGNWIEYEAQRSPDQWN